MRLGCRTKVVPAFKGSYGKAVEELLCAESFRPSISATLLTLLCFTLYANVELVPVRVLRLFGVFRENLHRKMSLNDLRNCAL